MNVWRTTRVYRFCLIPCQSFFECLEVRMLLRPIRLKERDTSDNGSVIGRRMHRRCFCGECHQKACV